jgi:hypothetical protein
MNHVPKLWAAIYYGESRLPVVLKMEVTVPRIVCTTTEELETDLDGDFIEVADFLATVKEWQSTVQYPGWVDVLLVSAWQCTYSVIATISSMKFV